MGMILAHRTWGEGNGKIALMVHGGRDASTTWKKVGPWLAERGYYAVAVDMPGHGGSQVEPGYERSLSRVASDLVETITSLRPEAKSIDLLIGHSLGGLASLTCVAENPGFAKRLVVEDTPGQSFDPVQVSYNTAKQIELARKHPDPGSVLPERESVTPEELSDKAAAAKATDPVYLPELMRTFADANINALVARSPVPTLVIVGKDYGEPVKGSWPTIKEYSLLSGEDRKQYIASLKQGKLVEVQEVGHYIHTLAFPQFVDALGSWLDEAD
jgi:pimeloyl-ACP methyl ester carboxylesterase